MKRSHSFPVMAAVVLGAASCGASMAGTSGVEPAPDGATGAVTAPTTPTSATVPAANPGGAAGATGAAGAAGVGGAGGSAAAPRDAGIARDGGASVDTGAATAPPPGPNGAPAVPKGVPTVPWWTQLVPQPDVSKPPMPDFGLVGFAGAVTGGDGGPSVVVSTAADLKAQAKKAGKLIIQVKGKIDLASTMITVTADKTIIGLGSDAQLDLGGLKIQGVKNVIVRNLIISNYRPNLDGVHIAQDAQNIWVDHCEFFTAPLLDAADKDIYDGAVDITEGAKFVTVSWNDFHDTWKTSLIAKSDSDSGTYEVTYHHNRFHLIGSRLPSIRFGTAHVFDNYYQGAFITGINTRMGAQVLVENNYFERTVDPIVAVDSKTKGGAVERNNLYFPADSKMVTAAGREALPGTLQMVPYQYKLDPADKVPALVVNWAGVGKLPSP
jgi:pectate lyase